MKPCPSHEGRGFFHKGLADTCRVFTEDVQGAIAIAKPDPALIAVLINREHSRLSSQVKTLEKALHAPFSDKEHQRLIQLAANWRALLAFDDGAPKLADALEVFVAAYRQQSPDQEKLHYEVVFQAGVYRMGHWALVKHFIPGVTDCLDNFGNVLPKHRDAFKRERIKGHPL